MCGSCRNTVPRMFHRRRPQMPRGPWKVGRQPGVVPNPGSSSEQETQPPGTGSPQLGAHPLLARGKASPARLQQGRAERCRALGRPGHSHHVRRRLRTAGQSRTPCPRVPAAGWGTSRSLTRIGPGCPRGSKPSAGRSPGEGPVGRCSPGQETWSRPGSLSCNTSGGLRGGPTRWVGRASRRPTATDRPRLCLPPPPPAAALATSAAGGGWTDSGSF